MLTLAQISAYFSDELVKKNTKGILVEYLQYEILDSLYKNKESAFLSFIGGTAVRIIHQNTRFSEDLDFDNFGLTFSEFEKLLVKVCKDMELKGFIIEFKTIEKGAYHCYIRFPEILYTAGISSHSQEKILVRIDTENKHKIYDPQTFLLNKFSVYRDIQITPVNILLSQKLITILQRKREKGRDLFDTSFLYGLTEPDYKYIEKQTNMNKKQFIKKLLARVETLDLIFLAKDVESFLFISSQKERILTFRSFLKQKLT